MRRIIYVLMIIVGIALLDSCKIGKQDNGTSGSADSKIVQQEDGTISLKVDKADRYSDKVDPASNTAEWNVVVSKSGRFDVWLSSATRDTINLNYKNSVRLNIRDHRLEARPECDKIIHNSSDVSLPYFRADSFLGSLYIQDTGLYTVQLISEKVVFSESEINSAPQADQTRLMSVIFVPLKK